MLLWEKKFLDNQKKLITDVSLLLLSTPSSIGKQVTDFIFSGLKEEEPWEGHSFLSTKMRKEQFSQVQLTKESFSYVIGQPDRQIKLAAKMIQ